MPVIQKTWKFFDNHYAQTYRHYQIRNKATADSCVYVTSTNHTKEEYPQTMMADALQAFTNVIIEDKE